MTRRSLIGSLGIALLLIGSGGMPEEAQPPQATPQPTVMPEKGIVFGMTPVVGVEATKERFARLTEYMSEQLKMPVRLLVTESYAELIDRVAAGQVDLAKLSPLAYVRAKKRLPALRLIASQVANGSENYSSYLVSLQANDHNSLDKLAGARICFANPNSTSGYLFPISYLKERNFDPQALFAGKTTCPGDHRACLEGLFEERWDLAATWAGAIRDARSEKKDVGELVIVAKTGRIPYDAYCLRPGLSSELADRVIETLLSTNTLHREGRRALAPTLGINGWVPVDDRIYDEIRKKESLAVELCPDSTGGQTP